MSSCGGSLDADRAVSAISSDFESIMEAQVVAIDRNVVERVVTSVEGSLTTRGWNVTFRLVTSLRGATPSGDVQAFVLDRSLGELTTTPSGGHYATRDHATVQANVRALLDDAARSGDHQFVVIRSSPAGRLASFVAPLDSSGVHIDGSSSSTAELLRRGDALRATRLALPLHDVAPATEARREVDPT